MREAMLRLAAQAYGVIQDPETTWAKRVLAFVVILLCANPFAAASLIAVFVLGWQMQNQHTRFLEASNDARMERREIADRSAKDRVMLEDRIALREERQTLEIRQCLKEVVAASDRVVAAVSGKQFIPKSSAKKEP